VIVNIAAWLYIVQAALGLSSLVLSPFGFRASMANLATLAFTALVGAMGVGLLRRDPRARWLALGNSLLGWTVGLLALLGILAAAAVGVGAIGLFSGKSSGGLLTGFGIIVVVILIIFLIGVVISFKLYWYLCSRDGCEEFGVPYGSSSAVAGSVGAWIAISIAYVVMSSGGIMAMLPMPSSQPSYEEVSREMRNRERERRAEQLEREREGGRTELTPSEAEELARIQAANPVATEPQVTTMTGDVPVVEEAPAPTIDVEPRAYSSVSDDEKPASNRILKCRDASGGISYTQGYCPPGSKEVATPKSE